MAYATVEDLQAGFRDLNEDERLAAAALLEEAAVIIDAYARPSTDFRQKLVVSCHMVRRAIGDNSGQSLPMGATQGTISAGGYSQSWTLSNGGTGELYLTKLDKKLLGSADNIGATNPFYQAGLVGDST